MAFCNFSPASIFLLIHFALFSRLSLAADPTISYDFKLSYITVSPLGVPQKDGVMCGVEQGLQVWVRGCGLDLDMKLRYQGGADDWTVDCGCGARDDDGERMVACDACHVWQHIRCNNIKDNEATNRMFACCRCKSGRKKC